MPTTDAGVVLITGASAGLGAEMARQLAARGYDLALCARRLERLEALADDVRGATGRRVEVAALDVTDADAVRRVFSGFATAFGHLDRVVVNAGVGSGTPIGTGRPDANLDTARTNFLGALHQSEAALEVFRAQQSGHLVLVSSVSAVRGMPRSMATYAASKAGVSALGEGIRAEGIPGVDVSVLHPGYIDSQMHEGSRKPALMVDTETGVRAMVAAIERRRAVAYVPRWPWLPIAMVMKVLPMAVLRRLV